jgi:hypothetical protein
MKLPATLLLGSLLATPACGKTSEPTSTDRPAPTPPESAAASSSAGGRPPPVRTPDWTFDPADPAKDYVGRYLRASMRYGAETSCVLLGKSTFRNGESTVEVRNPADGSCGKPGELRDAFLANVSTDRIRIDDPEHHPPMKAWPDGSMPDAGPGLVVEITDLHGWKTPLHDAIKQQQLYPLRVQLYGRGTYPVITLAGWHALFVPKGDLAALKPAAEALCTANKGAPMGFFAATDRTLMLRVDCPGDPHWEKLGL